MAGPSTVIEGNTPRLQPRDITWLVLALLAGVALRLVGQTTFPLGMDELVTVIEARDFGRGSLAQGPEARPLYIGLQLLLLRLLPESPVFLRLPALVFGCLGLLATFRLGRVVGGTRVGVAAVAITAMSPLHLFASSYARYWSLVYLLVTVATAELLIAYRSDRARHYLLAALLLVIGAFTHPTFLVAMTGVVVGVHLSAAGSPAWRWPSRRAWAWLWLPTLGAVGVAIVVAGVRDTAQAAYNGGVRDPASVMRLLPAVVEWSTVALWAGAALGLWTLWRVRRREVPDPVITLGLGAAATVALFLVAARLTAVYALWFVACLPFLHVLCAGLVADPELQPAVSREGARGVTALLVVLASMAPSTVSYLIDGSRWNYRPLYERMLQDRPDELVITYPKILQDYYAPRLRSIEISDTLDLDGTLAREQRLWVVVTRQRFGIGQDATGRLAQWLPDHCRQVDATERQRFDFRQYRAELYHCAVASPLPE